MRTSSHRLSSWTSWRVSKARSRGMHMCARACVPCILTVITKKMYMMWNCIVIHVVIQHSITSELQKCTKQRIILSQLRLIRVWIWECNVLPSTTYLFLKCKQKSVLKRNQLQSYWNKVSALCSHVRLESHSSSSMSESSTIKSSRSPSSSAMSLVGLAGVRSFWKTGKHFDAMYIIIQWYSSSKAPQKIKQKLSQQRGGHGLLLCKVLQV